MFMKKELKNYSNQKELILIYSHRSFLGNEKIELIDGTIYMKGEPSRRHQKVSQRLTLELGNFLKGKTCELYYDPFMVKLNGKTIVNPDIAVICDTNKLDDRGCNGAPDLMIVYILQNGDYDAALYSKKDIIQVFVLPGCEIILKDIFI